MCKALCQTLETEKRKSLLPSKELLPRATKCNGTLNMVLQQVNWWTRRGRAKMHLGNTSSPWLGKHKDWEAIVYKEHVR